MHQAVAGPDGGDFYTLYFLPADTYVLRTDAEPPVCAVEMIVEAVLSCVRIGKRESRIFLRTKRDVRRANDREGGGPLPLRLRPVVYTQSAAIIQHDDWILDSIRENRRAAEQQARAGSQPSPTRICMTVPGCGPIGCIRNPLPG